MGQIRLVLVVFVTLVCCVSVNSSKPRSCGRSLPVIFNFGDSNSDTGGLIAGMGFYLGPPRGRTFFNRSTGRWGDGRLIIDLLCEDIGANLLSPYLNSIDPDFHNGVNFAVAGASTLPLFIAGNLNIQLLQFGHFRNRTRELREAGSNKFFSEEQYRDALYMFDIGQNDLSFSFSSNLSYPQIIEKIPSFLSQIKDAIKIIYEGGGHMFWVHNTGPLGCLPQKLAMFKAKFPKLDGCGCLSVFNEAAKAFNDGLRELCDTLRLEMKNATIVYTDVFAIEHDLICNHSKYGFDQEPLEACCGFGGPPYNYNNTITCGVPGYTACAEDSRHISWDGVHYMEVANKFITSQILSTKFSNPRVKFQSLFKTQ